MTNPDVAAREQRFTDGGISLSPIPVKLNYVALEQGVTRLAWNMSIQFLDSVRWLDLNVDAETGALLSAGQLGQPRRLQCLSPPPGDPPTTAARSIQTDPHDAGGFPLRLARHQRESPERNSPTPGVTT